MSRVSDQNDTTRHESISLKDLLAAVGQKYDRHLDKAHISALLTRPYAHRGIGYHQATPTSPLNPFYCPRGVIPIADIHYLRCTETVNIWGAPRPFATPQLPLSDLKMLLRGMLALPPHP